MLTDEQLKAFGQMAISYAWLDGKVSDALGWLNQRDADTMRTDLAHDRTPFCKRLIRITDLVNHIADEHGHERGQVCKNIKSAIKRVREASNKRNELIHSHVRWTLAGGTIGEILVDPTNNCVLDCGADTLWNLAIECIESATELELAVRKFMEEIAGVSVPEVDVWYPPSEDDSDED